MGRRRSRTKPIHDYLPEVTNGLRRRHWIKFWIERWRSSGRMQNTTYAQHGLFWDIVAYAAEHDGVLPMTLDEFASTLGLCRRDRRAGFNADINRLIEVGLIEVEDGKVSVPRFVDMQA